MTKKIMYGLKGMNNIFYSDVFIEYAKLRGYEPVIIEQWSVNNAKQELLQKIKGNGDHEYIIYGYSLGVQTGREAIYAGAKPIEFVAVGPYSEVHSVDKLPVKTVIYGDTSSGRYGISKDEKGKPVVHSRIMHHVLKLEKDKHDKKI